MWDIFSIKIRSLNSKYKSNNKSVMKKYFWFQIFQSAIWQIQNQWKVQFRFLQKYLYRNSTLVLVPNTEFRSHTNTKLFLQWLQTISYIVFSNISDIWQVEKTSFTIKSGLFISLQVIWSQSPWFEYCSYARFIHLVSLFSVFVTYRHSSISAVSISTIFNLQRFIILSNFPPL